MTKSLALALCGSWLLFSGTLAAQSTTDFSKFKFGLNLSPSLSWIDTDDNRISGDGTALGLKLATQAEFFFAENYAIETGIGFHFNMGGTLLSDYGGRFFTEALPASDSQPYNNPNSPTQGNVRLDYAIQYLEIPLGLRLHTRDFGYLRYYVQAPMFTIGIRTGAMGEISGGGVAGGGENDLNIESEVRPLALSWGLGAGAEDEVGGGTRLVGGLQFQRLFTDVTKDGDYTYSGRTTEADPKAKINSLTLRLGILF